MLIICEDLSDYAEIVDSIKFARDHFKSRGLEKKNFNDSCLVLFR